MNSNTPVWPGLPAEKRAGFHEGWYFKANLPAQGKALWVRFTLLTTRNGFKREAAVWAVHFERNRETGEVQKVAIRQTFDISAFQTEETPEGPILRIGGCELSPSGTRGKITAKGKEISWDLKMAPRAEAAHVGQFEPVPETFAHRLLARGRIITVGEDLAFTGNVSVDGQTTAWDAAPGMQGHITHQRNGHSWAWAHCNAFVNQAGQSEAAAFEGLTVRTRLGGLVPSPGLSSFYFLYRGQEYRFNSLWSAFQSRSKHTFNEWHFSAERGDLRFRGVLKAQYRDFAGITLEDTDGSLLYCANSKLSDLEITVYRAGKLENTLRATGAASFEVADRKANPYVPLLI